MLCIFTILSGEPFSKTLLELDSHGATAVGPCLRLAWQARCKPRRYGTLSIFVILSGEPFSKTLLELDSHGVTAVGPCLSLTRVACPLSVQKGRNAVHSMQLYDYALSMAAVCSSILCLCCRAV